MAEREPVEQDCNTTGRLAYVNQCQGEGIKGKEKGKTDFPSQVEGTEWWWWCSQR
uniref:Uncharacterized protein n=1 Tax=Arundo donax TaxID=35708 RepID=A0A0A8YJ32_ARUDO